jgi:UDP-N-acetylmuramate--alanine ligase
MNELTRMGTIRTVHFIGIGGVGMSGIAEVLLNLGYRIQGSDLQANETTARLASLGARVLRGHRSEHVEGADVVVVSSAIGDDNVELQEARARRIPIVRRAEMLAELMRFRYGIAVAGSHGKTTTTALIASMLVEAHEDPTFVIGGRLNSAATNARLGGGRYLVAEADESDGTFLLYQPLLAVVTNVDRDHLGAYEGDFANLVQAFWEFIHHLPFYGTAVLCLDDPILASFLPRLARPVLTYGFDERADVRARAIRFEGLRSHFELVRRRRPGTVNVTLNLIGFHNVLNALAAVGVAELLGLEDEAFLGAFARFQGTGRRFQIHGATTVGGKRLTVVEDYAHHPREIEATLAAARQAWPGRRVVVVFQPHRYSRTRDLLDAFAVALGAADVLLLTEVYPGGERPLPGVNGQALAAAVRARGRLTPLFAPDLEALVETLAGTVEDDDIVLVLGAGDIGRLPARLRTGGGP